MSKESFDEIKGAILKDFSAGRISLNKACSLLFTLATISNEQNK